METFTQMNLLAIDPGTHDSAFCLYDEVPPTPFKKIITRRDVRRLCIALGVPLK